MLEVSPSILGESSIPSLPDVSYVTCVSVEGYQTSTNKVLETSKCHSVMEILSFIGKMCMAFNDAHDGFPEET